jgi:putative glutathione S-transferase
MGLLIDGKWADQWYDTKSNDGKFVRSESQFRHWVTHDGLAGPTGDAGFNAEIGRYHLYVSLACPWAHRTLLFRALKGLESMITISVVNAYMGEQGWTFTPGDGVIEDSLFHSKHLHQIYTQADPHYTGRVTVPVLWDKKRNTIVSNESADIIRMLNSAFDHLGAKAGDFYPEVHREAINKVNDYVYPNINNGVYRAGFATTQTAYNEAVTELFNALDTLEQQLSTSRYLVGDTITEADWRLFTTLVRFDAVYVGHFKCNLKRIVDYPNLWGYLRDLYQQEGVADTVDINYTKAHYYGSHTMINPTGVIPRGPVIDFLTPHRRG